MGRSSAAAIRARTAARSGHERRCTLDATRLLSTAALGAMGLAGERRTVSVDERFAYVGTYTTDGRSQGIYRLWLNAETGALRLDGVAAKSANPSYLALHPNGRVLYAVNELSEFRGEPSGAVSAYAIARA